MEHTLQNEMKLLLEKAYKLGYDAGYSNGEFNTSGYLFTQLTDETGAPAADVEKRLIELLNKE
ncbi:MAG: hypothetical protein ACK45G_11415 [Bacteroidota bacterium]|jgi:hypothetical protein